jgi:acetoin utilization protein AcuB
MQTAATPIETWMTSNVHTIGDDQTLAQAQARMREHGVRHLPVLKGGHLRGIVSERDIAFVESLPGVEPGAVKISEAMTDEPYVVSRGTAVGEVIEQMARHKYGATVIVDGDRPIGIFTTIDALHLAAKLLEDAGT